MENTIAYFNGEYVNAGEGHVHIRDLGFLRGYGVFDVSPIYNEKLFFHKEHWERFEKSAWELGLHIPISREEHESIVHELLKRNEKKGGVVVRTVLTGGVSENGLLPENKETFCVLLEAMHHLPVSIYELGSKMETIEHARRFPSAKTTDYITPIRYRKKNPLKKDIFELLYVSEGKVLEASTSNVCVVKDGVIYAPHEGVLGGITCLIALRLAHRENISVYGQDVSVDELFDADEVFLTASNKGIVPVVEIDNKMIGSGVPGPITKKLMEAYQELIRNY